MCPWLQCRHRLKHAPQSVVVKKHHFTTSSRKLHDSISIMVQLETTHCADSEIISQIHNEWENVAVQSKTDEITFEGFDSDFWLIHRDIWRIIIATSPHNGSKEKPNGGMWVLVKVALSVLRCSYAMCVVEGQILDASALHLILVWTEGAHRAFLQMESVHFISIFYNSAPRSFYVDAYVHYDSTGSITLPLQPEC